MPWWNCLILEAYQSQQWAKPHPGKHNTGPARLIITSSWLNLTVAFLMIFGLLLFRFTRWRVAACSFERKQSHSSECGKQLSAQDNESIFCSTWAHHQASPSLPCRQFSRPNNFSHRFSCIVTCAGSFSSPSHHNNIQFVKSCMPAWQIVEQISKIIIARVLQAWQWLHIHSPNPTLSPQKITTGHLIFQDGGPKTRDVHQKTNKKKTLAILVLELCYNPSDQNKLYIIKMNGIVYDYIRKSSHGGLP